MLEAAAGAAAPACAPGPAAAVGAGAAELAGLAGLADDGQGPEVCGAAGATGATLTASPAVSGPADIPQ